jgi:hypothetical protein
MVKVYTLFPPAVLGFLYSPAPAPAPDPDWEDVVESLSEVATQN